MCTEACCKEKHYKLVLNNDSSDNLVIKYHQVYIFQNNCFRSKQLNATFHEIKTAKHKCYSLTTIKQKHIHTTYGMNRIYDLFAEQY